MTYDNVEMDAYRQEIWNRNADFVKRHNAEHNAGRATFSVEMNKFAAMTSDEFGATYRRPMTKRSADSANAVFVGNSTDAPDAFDWRTVPTS